MTTALATLPRPDLSDILVEGLTLARADTPLGVEAAQRLRYQVFYEERGAHPVGEMGALRRDIDIYDPAADHLLVMDTSLAEGSQAVGTYRLLLDERARAGGVGLYSESRYDLTALRRGGGKIMELSRSCVLASHRRRATIALLWHGIAEYVFHYDIDYMIGLVSFPGNDLEEHALPLAFLNQFCAADPSFRPVVRPHLRAELPDLPPLDRTAQRQAMRALPPLVRAYLKSGAGIGDGVMIDHQFNTIVACMVLDCRAASASFRAFWARKSGYTP